MRYSVELSRLTREQRQRAILDDETTIHVDKVVVRQTFQRHTYFSGENEGRDVVPMVVKDIFEIDGITRVVTFRFKLRFQKADLFAWEELVPQVVETLKRHLDPDGSVIEIKFEEL